MDNVNKSLDTTKGFAPQQHEPYAPDALGLEQEQQQQITLSDEAPQALNEEQASTVLGTCGTPC